MTEATIEGYTQPRKTLTNREAEDHLEFVGEEHLFQNYVQEASTQDYEPDPLEVHYRRPLPAQLIRRYAKLAAQRADTEQLEDGTWFASIRSFPGVWAQGGSEEEVLEEIESVVRDWACLKIVDQDKDLPVLDTIDLNVV